MMQQSIMNDLFLERQLELAERIVPIVGSNVEKITSVEYLRWVWWGVEFKRRLSFSEIRNAERKERINVTIVFEDTIPKEAIPKLNKIMHCHYLIHGNELWYSMKPERPDSYMKTQIEQA